MSFSVLVIVVILGGCNHPPNQQPQEETPRSSEDKFLNLLIEKFDTSVNFQDDFDNAIKFLDHYWGHHSWQQTKIHRVLTSQTLRQLRQTTLQILRNIEPNELPVQLIKTLLVFRLTCIAKTLIFRHIKKTYAHGASEEWFPSAGTDDYLDKAYAFSSDTFNIPKRLCDPIRYKNILSVCIEEKIFNSCSSVLIQAWMSIVFAHRVVGHETFGDSMDVSFSSIDKYLEFLDRIVLCRDKSSMIVPFKSATEILIRIIRPPDMATWSLVDGTRKHIGSIIKDFEHVTLPSEC